MRLTLIVSLACLSLRAQNVGIGTATPQQRLHVNGKIIANDGLTGLPSPSVWGTDGSRLILWPGTATTHPYQIGIAGSTLWYGVPQGAQHSFYHGGNEVFAITPTTRGIVNVGGSVNFPSIWLGTLIGAFNTTGPYPTRGTLIFFGGPTGSFPHNTDPALMYFAHLANDVSRLRIHVEDNLGGGQADGVSIMGRSCAGTCNDIATSQLLFDFVTDGEAYKAGGGPWAAISDRRTKAEWHPYTRGLAELRALQPVSYRYSEKYFPAFRDRWYTGLIAQEVQQVAPEMVSTYRLQYPGDRLEEVLAVNPNDLTYMLINAVKDLDAENARLRARVDALEQEQNTLRSQVQALMDRLAAVERQAASSH